MKEPARATHKGLCYNREFHPQSNIAYGSFKTIPNPFKQLPAKNLIIPEAPLESICFKGLKCYENSNLLTEKTQNLL